MAIFALSSFVSCDSNTIIDQNQSIDNRSWKYDDKKIFKVHVTDISKKYDVLLNIRHSSFYPYANLFVLIDEKAPKTKEYTFRKELKLAELDGKWTGKSAGSLYAHQTLIHQDYVFPDTGLYTFSIVQNMRDNPLKEITDVGLNIVAK